MHVYTALFYKLECRWFSSMCVEIVSKQNTDRPNIFLKGIKKSGLN